MLGAYNGALVSGVRVRGLACDFISLSVRRPSSALYTLSWDRFGPPDPRSDTAGRDVVTWAESLLMPGRGDFLC
jgi:hypothetical protein